MSSSDHGAGLRRFLAGFAAGMLGVAALVTAVLLTVDPMGAGDGNRFCAAGAKRAEPLDVKILVANRLRPRTIVLGTSRVNLGFSQAALASLGPGPAANLGVDNGVPADFALLAGDALAGGRLERVFIGVDFNSVHFEGPDEPGESLAGARFPEWERLRHGFFGPAALSALPRSLVDCRPRFHADGAPVLEADGTVVGKGAGAGGVEMAQLLERRSALLGDAGWQRFAGRTAQLRELIGHLRARGISVVIFSAPYRDDLQPIFEQAGLDDEFARFHRELATLADAEGVPFVDFTGPAERAAMALPPCPDGGIGCHYQDLTHYSPFVAERLAERLALAADGRAAP